MKGIPLIITAVLMGAVGQIIMKKGMQIYGEVTAGGDRPHRPLPAAQASLTGIIEF